MSVATAGRLLAVSLGMLGAESAWVPEVLVEPPPVVPVSAPLLSVEARQTFLMTHLADNWRLSSRQAATVVRAAYKSAARHDIDPLLLLAIAGRESSFRHIGNPDGGTDPEQPFGIMQVAGQWHREKFPEGDVRETTLAENFELGAQVLREYLDRERGEVRRALLRYNGSLDRDDRYSKEVLAIKEKLRQAGGLAES